MTRDPSTPLHGDTWTVRDGHSVIVASNDWPPPKPGTHESDLCGTVGFVLDDPDGTSDVVRGGCVEFGRAWLWSRTHQAQEAQ